MNFASFLEEKNLPGENRVTYNIKLVPPSLQAMIPGG